MSTSRAEAIRIAADLIRECIALQREGLEPAESAARVFTRNRAVRCFPTVTGDGAEKRITVALKTGDHIVWDGRLWRHIPA